MMTPEFLADLLRAILANEDDELILALLAPLSIVELQDLALAGSNLKQLCQIAAENIPDGSEER
jgi:hypothetical protein